MPRIRTLKPEHKGHRKVGRLSDRAYRLWVGLITEADDQGRIVCDLGHFRAAIFGYQKPTEKKVSEALAEIITLGLIQHYEAGGVEYLHFQSWAEHQRIDKPRPSTLPEPPTNSTNDRRSIQERSSTPRAISYPTDPILPKGSERSTELPDGLSATAKTAAIRYPTTEAEYLASRGGGHHE